MCVLCVLLEQEVAMQRRYKRREDLRELAAVLILKVLQKQEKQKKQTMENYEIKYKLGSGNFAKVYLAIDNSSGKEVGFYSYGNQFRRNIGL